jgi:hypothetical protein
MRNVQQRLLRAAVIVCNKFHARQCCSNRDSFSLILISTVTARHTSSSNLLLQRLNTVRYYRRYIDIGRVYYQEVSDCIYLTVHR